ncbi:type II toxin-antitoxin system VapC family toxin [Desulfofundulus thermosubterraneus]|uniref:PIN domain nuclease, a component of toxin-antitoxin system (PIN domain) n=1 Tax=Desulfofundulus thermosubterraneus DSM 16057 TaxID=1121432 RepID=A0A1M6E0B9_9FIRM|nr:PIN domain nuclease, a component of toxin-antitoxin system (PIN domain) [Desulfofundulus thermosubterraneus DSM 16057]
MSPRARKIISSGENKLYLSAASGWEMAIKARLGKLSLPDNPEPFILEQLAVNAIEPLAVSMRHALHVYTLLDFHRDPFERLLIAQAQLENLPIITADPQIASYPVEVVW